MTADGTVKTLPITGHSLGPALATLLAIDVAGNGVFASPTVYTFASPTVGDKIFASTYDGLVPNSCGIANRNDIVTQALLRNSPDTSMGDAEVPINSDDRTKHTLRCWHALNTYRHIGFHAALDADVCRRVSGGFSPFGQFRQNGC